MSFVPVQHVRSAAVDQVDKFVLKRMGTLLDRARRGTGRRDADVAQLWDRGSGNVLRDPAHRRAIIDQFHRLYYQSRMKTWRNTRYRGVKVLKCPLDLWVYQELIHELRPALIVETGTAHGGSGLYLSDLCDTVGNGEVVTIDIDHRRLEASHPRLTAIRGSSVDPAIVGDVRERARDANVVLVLLDSDHSASHVLEELRIWSDFVTPGSYVVVEDTHVNGNPVSPGYGEGPAEAVEAFLREDNRFRVDLAREKFMLTFNRGGFLQRVE